MTKEILVHGCDINGTIYLTSFWNGKERCVQLTPSGIEYTQMTYSDARKFFKDAIKAINKIETKYNKNRPWWESLSEAMEEAKHEKSIKYKPKGAKNETP